MFPLYGSVCDLEASRRKTANLPKSSTVQPAPILTVFSRTPLPGRLRPHLLEPRLHLLKGSVHLDSLCYPGSLRTQLLKGSVHPDSLCQQCSRVFILAAGSLARRFLAERAHLQSIWA
jgi:hypothetical protein